MFEDHLCRLSWPFEYKNEPSLLIHEFLIFCNDFISHHCCPITFLLSCSFTSSIVRSWALFLERRLEKEMNLILFIRKFPTFYFLCPFSIDLSVCIGYTFFSFESKPTISCSCPTARNKGGLVLFPMQTVIISSVWYIHVLQDKFMLLVEHRYSE